MNQALVWPTCKALVLLVLVGGCTGSWVSKKPSSGPGIGSPAARSPLAPPEPSTWEKAKRWWNQLVVGSKPKAQQADPLRLDRKTAKNPELLCALGQLHLRAGHPEKALRHFQEALRLDPQYLPAHTALARLYDRQGKFDLALKHYRQAVQLKPQQASLHNDLGVCLARAGKLAQAAQALRHAVRLKPQEVRYRNNLATVLVHLGQIREAQQHLQAVHPPEVAAYNLGYLLAQAQRPQLARQFFIQALQHNPQMAAARWWLDRLSSGGTRATMHAASAGWTPGVNTPGTASHHPTNR